MKAHKPPRKVWLGRSERSGSYGLGTNKKHWNSYWGFEDNGITSFCQQSFESVTGIRLEPGELRQVRIAIEEINP